jgi:hypothetical protein
MIKAMPKINLKESLWRNHESSGNPHPLCVDSLIQTISLIIY